MISLMRIHAQLGNLELTKLQKIVSSLFFIFVI